MDVYGKIREITQNNQGLVKCLWTLFIFYGSMSTVSSTLMFDNWRTEISPPIDFAHAAVAYDSDINRIYLVGGTAPVGTPPNQGQQRLLTLDVNDDTTLTEDNFDDDFFAPLLIFSLGQSYVQIRDTLWMINSLNDYDTDNILDTFNIKTDAISRLDPDGTIVSFDQDGCLASYTSASNKDYLIVISDARTQIYSFDTDSWLTSVPQSTTTTTTRTWFACITVNDELYAIGEDTDGAAQLQPVEYLDISQIDTPNFPTGWMSIAGLLPSITGELADHRVVIICDQIVIVGGEDRVGRSSVIVSTINVIDPITKTIAGGGQLNIARKDLQLVVTDRALYALGGTGGGSGDEWQVHTLPICPTDCFHSISEWTVVQIGQSSQFRFYNLCNDKQFIRVRMDSLIEYDSINQKATKNRINSFAGQEFTFTLGDTSYDDDGNMYPAIRNIFDTTVSVGQGKPDDKIDVGITLETIVFYESELFDDENDNGIFSNTLKWSLAVSDWPFEDGDNTLTLCLSLMTNGVDSTDASVANIEDFVFREPTDATYDDQTRSDVISEINSLHSHHASICYTFTSFTTTLYYDPFIDFVGGANDKPNTQQQPEQQTEQQTENIVFISVGTIIGFIIVTMVIFFICCHPKKKNNSMANTIQLSELTHDTKSTPSSLSNSTSQ